MPTRFRPTILTGAALVAALLAATPLLASDWPHWRGPDRDGSSGEQRLPLVWDAETNVLWKLPLPGLSGSTPIVWGDRLFLNVTEGDSIHLWSVDLATGEPLWQRPCVPFSPCARAPATRAGAQTDDLGPSPRRAETGRRAVSP